MTTQRCQIHLAFEKIFFSDNFTLDCTYGEAETQESFDARRKAKQVLSDEEEMTDEEDSSRKKIVRKHWRNLDRFVSLLDGKYTWDFFYETFSFYDTYLIYYRRFYFFGEKRIVGKNETGRIHSKLEITAQ